jgi:hypothetical protein
MSDFDVDAWLDSQWSMIAENPEFWAASVLWALPLEDPAPFLIAAGERSGLSSEDAKAIVARVSAEWRRLLEIGDRQKRERQSARP